jgi:hypothetical protein
LEQGKAPPSPLPSPLLHAASPRSMVNRANKAKTLAFSLLGSIVVFPLE